MTSGHSDDEPHACFILLLSPQSLKRMYLEKNGGLLEGGQGGERRLRDGTRQPLFEFEFKQRWFQEGQF